MRIAVAVVVGVVLLSVGHVVSAAEARRQRSEKCIEICNFTFEKCQEGESSKSNGRCNIDAVRCKNACPFETIEEPAVPTAMSHQRCVDSCQLTYKKCLGRAENKRGGNCAADDVRCEQACPKPPEPVVAGVPPADPNAPPGSIPAVTAPAPKSKPKRGTRVEGAAAPAPVSATPIHVPPAPRAVDTDAPARRDAVAPAASAPAAASAARPAPQERGFFGTIGCFFVACEPSGSTPCLQQCASAYDQCHVRESKRGGECNTRLMNCRKDCSTTAD